ncbi:MAG TPA: toxic anion resistance protein [Tissierellia bacterium]|nr:toxic anion resistance protein [Tissierellia bacterium]
MSEITLETLQKNKPAFEEPIEDAEHEIAKIEHQLAEITPEQRQEIDRIKDQIDLMDNKLATEYGVDAQKNLSQFSETILSQVKSKDAGYVGDIMTDLMVKVRSLELEQAGEKSSWLDNIPFLRKANDKMGTFLARYEDLDQQIDKIEAELDVARLQMLTDISNLDSLYANNLDYFNQLQLYIIAGQEKLAEMREETIPRLRQEAASSGEPMSAQLVADFEDTVNRFEKKVHDLEISKTLAIQTAPQIKLIQNNDKQLVDKIQTAMLNTIPLWKSQIVIALGLHKQENVLKMQKQVTDTTNELLLKNAEQLKTSSIEVARESERSIVDVETLKKVNQDLIETIEETLRIHTEGREKRQAAQQELTQIEERLKETLLLTKPQPSNK